VTARITLALLSALCGACATTGSGWLAEAWDPSHAQPGGDDELPPVPQSERQRTRTQLTSRVIDEQSATADSVEATGSHPGAVAQPASGNGGARVSAARTRLALEGKVLGVFRNTYYDFPSESEFSGESVALYDAQCKSKATVPRGFFETLCVQGSGLLATGNVVSFNRRDCACAPVCPRTGQRICYDVLDIVRYPWGRGATGEPITPLLTVAVDTSVVALGTALYIPDFDGLPRDAERRSSHDGCFIAQDRGLRVQGQHVDIFTGRSAMTRLWNSLVPSNSGVTVVINSPRCTGGRANW
jgi:3D (Asp-Asp-Asp) domain-containing protein